MKLSEQLQDLEGDLIYPGTGIDVGDRHDLLCKVRETIPLAQTMETVVSAASRIIERWDHCGLGGGDEKLINALGDALRHYESLQSAERKV